MYTILLTSSFFLLIVLSMPVGCILSKRTTKGSCDGISSLGTEKVCDCETPCDTLQKRLDRQNTAKSISVDR